ncbi:MAG: hypothetical protein IT181_22535 [Acidobacteria bacterium]|nr:hypothetical protein [Acidobacteriota bacterium]
MTTRPTTGNTRPNTTGWREAARARLHELILAAFLIGTAGAAVCEAQQSGAAAPQLYLQLGPALTVHAEGEQYHRAGPPLKGTTFGGAAAVGVWLVPAVALELEGHVDRALSGAQTDVYNFVTTYTAESRDVVFGGNLRLRSGGRVPVEFAAGGGVVFTRFARRDITSTDVFFGRTTRSPDRRETAANPTLAAALALAVPLSERVELVPAVGARWIRRPFDTEAWYFGVGRYQVFASVALRVRS